MAKLKAILFDLDGTLRDTRELIYSALDHAFTELGLPSPTVEELAPYVHHHSFVHKQFAPDVTLEDFEQVYGAKVEQMLPGVQLYEQAAETLEQLQAAGYKLAIVTAARSAPQGVQDHGIDTYLSTLVSARDITKHKPDPEGTKLALERLHVAPEEAIMVGDMPTDTQAGQAAGLLATVGVTHGLGSKEALQAAGTDYIIGSLGELPAVIKKIEQK